MLNLFVSTIFMLGDDSERDPPDSITTSEVKPLSADDSVGGIPM